ncbi:MAG: RNA methyltransferase [Eubacterium sp.]|nr:RNA methyltransferase [Eubacterium sp.]
MITSKTNDRIKYIEKLKTKASFRREEQCFIVEGIRMIREVPKAWRRELYLTEKAAEEYPELMNWCGAVELVSEPVMEKLADTKTPQGMLAVVSMGDSPVNPGHTLIFVLDGVQDPGNVGTILRTAEAVGAAEVLLSRDSADPFSPKTVRSTMGAIFRVPVRVAEDLPSAVRELKNKWPGIKVCGMHLDGTGLYRADLSGPVAVLIGSEGNGLTEAVSLEADTLLRIPMEGQVESLNAAISAAVMGYEVYRQHNFLHI